MANEQSIKNFTAADIAAYHQGRLSSKEMHALEKAALEDPFLADALEGYHTEGINIPVDLNDLSERLKERTSSAKKVVMMGRSSYSWLKIAALIVVIAGAGLLIYQLGTGNKQQNTLARENTSIPSTTVVNTDDSAKNPASATADTINTNVATVQANNANETTATVPKDLLPEPSAPQASAESKSNAITTDSINPSGYNDIAIANRQMTDKKLDAQKQEADKRKEFAAKESETLNQSALKKSRVASPPVANANNGYANNSNNYALNDSYTNKTARSGLANNFNIFRGRVTDEANNPLPFVNITNPVDNVGTYSDAKGNFTITFPDSVLDVNVRSLGFVNKNMRLSNSAADNQIVMQDDRANLNEVVVSNKKINSKRRDNNMVLEEPEPADGWTNYDRYLANNLNVPETFLTRQNSGGEVELSFEVNKQGEPVNIKVEKSLCDTCDKEAIRAIKEGPKWKRKAKKGRTSVTISF